MKIALVILHADPTRGGAERYTVDLAQALRKRSHDVTILSSSFPPSPSTLGEGLHCVELRSSGFTRSARYRAFLDSLDDHLASTSYDIIHAMLPVRRCDVYHPHAGMAVDAIHRGSRLKRLQNRLNRRGAFANVERSLLEQNNPPIVIALSNYVGKSIQLAYPQLPGNHIATLFNAVDLTHFQPPATDENSTTALFVGQDFMRKGLDKVIRALPLVPALRLSVVGKENPSTWKSLCASLGVEPRVTFAGPARDVRHHYANAGFLILPTKHDPCSLVVLEALAMGLPVISTKFNGACEVMTNGVHGFILDDPDDTNALSDAMRRLCDPSLRARMRQACLQLRPRLSYELHLDRLLDIYQEARKR